MSDDDIDNSTSSKCLVKLDGINPQVQMELEQLNCATDSINRLELELDDARAQFRALLVESTQKIDALAKKLGGCVEKSRPYYEARIRAKEALQRTHQAAARYERAASHHQAAKELVALAEEGLTTKGHVFDQSWQEMLNHSTEKVNGAERERVQSAQNHETCSRQFQNTQNRVKQLHRQLKREIARSRMGVRRSLLSINALVNALNLQLLPYFEMKAHFNQLMEMQKSQVSQLESEVAAAKLNYADGLQRLERISNQIHQARGAESAGAPSPLGDRGVGVGAESAEPRPRLPGSSTLPDMLGQDPLGLDDEFYPPPCRITVHHPPAQVSRSDSDGCLPGMDRSGLRRHGGGRCSDTESLASVSTVSSVEPLSDGQIGYIALDDDILLGAGATCLVNHNFSMSPPGERLDAAADQFSELTLTDCEDEERQSGSGGSQLAGDPEQGGGSGAAAADVESTTDRRC